MGYLKIMHTANNREFKCPYWSVKSCDFIIFRYQVWCNVGPTDRSMWYHVSSGDTELLLSTIYVPVSAKHDHRHCMSLDLSTYVR
jgi:hypothetical protein